MMMMMIMIGTIVVIMMKIRINFLPDKKCICTAAESFFNANNPCHMTGYLLSKSNKVSALVGGGGGGGVKCAGVGVPPDTGGFGVIIEPGVPLGLSV